MRSQFVYNLIFMFAVAAVFTFAGWQASRTELPKFIARTQVLVIQRTLDGVSPRDSLESAQYLSVVFSNIINTQAFFQQIQRAGFDIRLLTGVPGTSTLSRWQSVVFARAYGPFIVIESRHRERQAALRVAQLTAQVLSTQSSQWHGSGNSVILTVVDPAVVTTRALRQYELPVVVGSLAVGLLLGSSYLLWRRFYGGIYSASRYSLATKYRADQSQAPSLNTTSTLHVKADRVYIKKEVPQQEVIHKSTTPQSLQAELRMREVEKKVRTQKNFYPQHIIAPPPSFKEKAYEPLAEKLSPLLQKITAQPNVRRDKQTVIPAVEFIQHLKQPTTAQVNNVPPRKPLFDDAAGWKRVAKKIRTRTDTYDHQQIPVSTAQQNIPESGKPSGKYVYYNQEFNKLDDI